MRRRHCNRLPARPSRLIAQATVPGFIDTSLVPNRAGLDQHATVQRMASDMREASHREGGMTREGLELLGYTKQQIDTFASAARQLANEQAAMT